MQLAHPGDTGQMYAVAQLLCRAMSYPGVRSQTAAVDLILVRLPQTLTPVESARAVNRTMACAGDQVMVPGFSLDCVLAMKEKATNANHNWLHFGAMPCALFTVLRPGQSIRNSPLTWMGFQPDAVQFNRAISKAVTKEVSMEIDSITSQLVHSLPPILNLFSLSSWLQPRRLAKSSDIRDTSVQWRGGQRPLGGGRGRNNAVP